MSSKDTIKVVEKIATEGVSAVEVEHLLDIAAYTIDRISSSMAKQAEFDLSEFGTAKARGISDFHLRVGRGPRSDHEIWSADFTSPGRRLLLQISVVKRV